MDNYEINILRRNGNWKKVKPKDLILDYVDQNNIEKKYINTDSKFVKDNFLSYLLPHVFYVFFFHTLLLFHCCYRKI